MKTKSRSKREQSSLKRRIKEIQDELAALQKFRPTKQRNLFIRQLVGEQSYLKRQLSSILSSFSKRDRKETKRERLHRLTRANKQRRVKNERRWRYFRAIKKNWHPEMSLRKISTQHRKHKEGLESEISDIEWRNPSP